MNTDITVQGLVNIANNLACYIADIAFLLLVIFIILSGFRWMAAGGNSEKVGKAKKNFTYVLIGGLVILGVSGIINTVAVAVGSSFRIGLGCLLK